MPSAPWNLTVGREVSFFFFLVLPVYCYQPISLHPRAHMLSHVTPWTATRQAPLSMDFSRQEYWSGLPFPSPGRQVSSERSELLLTVELVVANFVLYPNLILPLVLFHKLSMISSFSFCKIE